MAGPPKRSQWPYGPMTLWQVLHDDIEAFFAGGWRAVPDRSPLLHPGPRVQLMPRRTTASTGPR
jgi:hypothetical protein